MSSEANFDDKELKRMAAVLAGWTNIHAREKEILSALKHIRDARPVGPSESELMAWIKDPAWPHPTWTGPEVRAVYSWLRSQIRLEPAPSKEWKGREFAEKTFSNVFERLQYVAEARHVNLDDAAYDANEYFKELIQLACSEGLKPALRMPTEEEIDSAFFEWARTKHDGFIANSPSSVWFSATQWLSEQLGLGAK